jgi:hypothetical protein
VRTKPREQDTEALLACISLKGGLLITLSRLDVGDGSTLVIGVMGDEEDRQPETNVPRDAELVFGHQRPRTEEELYPFRGRLNSHYPVMVNGRPHVVLFGEVGPEIDYVLLEFAEPESEPHKRSLAIVGEPLGRRVWISHPEPFGRKLHVSVAWLHGPPEHYSLPASGGMRPEPPQLPDSD